MLKGGEWGEVLNTKLIDISKVYQEAFNFGWKLNAPVQSAPKMNERRKEFPVQHSCGFYDTLIKYQTSVFLLSCRSPHQSGRDDFSGHNPHDISPACYPVHDSAVWRFDRRRSTALRVSSIKKKKRKLLHFPCFKHIKRKRCVQKYHTDEIT